MLKPSNAPCGETGKPPLTQKVSTSARQFPERLLQVSTEFFTAGAVWQHIFGIWSCTKAAPILHWMIGMNAAQAKIALLKMQADYQWIA